MRRTTFTLTCGLGLGLSLGCGPMIVLDGETDEDGSTGEPPPGTTAPVTTSAPPPSTDGPVPPPGDSTTGQDASDSAMSFIPGDDGPDPDSYCDIFEQDCPDGEKCTVWAEDGGSSWNSTRCVPVAEDPGAPGDPCTVEVSGLTGIDDCERGSMCWDVDLETLMGHCIAFCTGSPEAPTCDVPNTSCHLTSGPLALCLPNCDPIAQDCPEGQGCYGIPPLFTCAPDASGETGAAGDECEFVNICDPGNFCAAADVVPDCMGGIGCCSSFCALDDPAPPCLPGQVCTPWWEEGEAPPGYERVGACVLPM